MTRLAVFGLAFVLLTVLGTGVAVWSGGVDSASWLALKALPPWSVGVAICMAIGLVLVEVFRFWVFGWALGVRLSFRACLDATIANNFFAWLTPGAALADPAAIYVLHRHGVPPELGAILSFGKGATGFCFMLLFTAVFLLLGYGPPMNGRLLGFFAWGALFGASMIGVLWTAAFAPETAHAVVRWLQDRTERIGAPAPRRWLTGLWSAAARAIDHLAHYPWTPSKVLALVGAHLLYMGTFIGVLVALTAGFGASPLEVMPRAMIFQTFTYILPTPGGSGFAEAAATSFLGDLLAADQAVMAVLAYRALTFHAHVVLGLVYLPTIGVMRGILGVSE